MGEPEVRVRSNILLTGIVLLAIGVVLLPAMPYVISGSIALVGLALIFVGALSPDKKTSDAYDYTPLLQKLTSRVWSLEWRLWETEQRLNAAERRISGEPVEMPVQEELPVEAPPAAVPSATEQVQVTPVPQPQQIAEPPPSTPSVAKRPTLPTGVSRLEMELGERWFQRIGIIVLAVAFLSFLAIAIPNMTPEQIVAVDFISALGIGLIGEYLYLRKKLHFYAKGLLIGAFAIAHIGIWGGGFYFRLTDFPWQFALGTMLVLGGAAALRYKSPFMSFQTGFLFLAWIGWLRMIDELTALNFSMALAVGGIGVLAMVLAQRQELPTIILVFAVDAFALASFALVDPHGLLPALVLGFITIGIVTLVRHEKIIKIKLLGKFEVWVFGIILTYALALVYAIQFTDLVIVAVVAIFTVLLAVGEFSNRDTELTLPFAGLTGLLLLLAPFVMNRGEFAFGISLVLLIAIALVKPVKGLAWMPNLTYFGLVVLAFYGVLGYFTIDYYVVWAFFLGTMAVHVFLQKVSGYAIDLKDVPADFQVIFLAVILCGITARILSGETALILYAVVIPLTIFVNRGSFWNEPIKLPVTILGLGLAFGLARWWSFMPVLGEEFPAETTLLATYHIVGMLILCALVFRYERRMAEDVRGKKIFHPSAAILTLLVGLVAQDAYVAPLFIALPLAVVVIAYRSKDAFTFNLSYIVLTLQFLAGSMRFLDTPSDVVYALPLFATLHISIGFYLNPYSDRRAISKSSQLVGAVTWFVIAPITFGPGVVTTVSWSILGAVTVAWGLWRGFADIRYVGFFVFFAVLGKAFIYDIAGLPIEIRILGLVILALALLAISYGYTKYRKRHVEAVTTKAKLSADESQ